MQFISPACPIHVPTILDLTDFCFLQDIIISLTMKMVFEPFNVFRKS